MQESEQMSLPFEADDVAALQAARAAYDIEAACITEMKDYIDDAQFAKAIELLSNAERIGTCATCTQAKFCDFETNPIQIPKQVQKVIRQGNMQMQTIVRNPEREKETCMKGCPCWDSEQCVCLRQTGFCKAWRI